jgi:hypothetical protein
MERFMNRGDPESSTTPASLPEQSGRLALFGPPPLLEGEDTPAYDELLVRISGTVKPADIFEEIWVRDIVDLVWDAFRLRRLKAKLIKAVAHEGLEDILKPLIGWSDANDLAKAWAARERSAIEQVDELLASAGLTMDSVMAKTLSLKLDHIERIDRMITAAEGRRNAILRELDRHRAMWGQDLPRAAHQIERAEFKVIEPRPRKKRAAA